MINYIIFYGSLMQKMGGRGLNLEAEGLDFIQDITFPGRLYSLTSYPAMVMGDGEVKGELFSIRNQEVMHTFDRIEGYSGNNPDRHLYTRTVVRVPEIGDYAWVYTYNSSLDESRYIESGDWYGFTKAFG